MLCSTPVPLWGRGEPKELEKDMPRLRVGKLGGTQTARLGLLPIGQAVTMAAFARREGIKYATFAGWMAEPSIRFAEMRLAAGSGGAKCAERVCWGAIAGRDDGARARRSGGVAMVGTLRS